MDTLMKPPLTEDEYLRLDREAATKSEYHDGQMFAMAGGSLNHSLLANSIGALLRSQVPTGCRVFNADLRIRYPHRGLIPTQIAALFAANLSFPAISKTTF
jgi:Uma2 family endonuclease